MATKLGQNIDALKAARQLGKNSNSLADVFERLASGLRINSPGDDPAGLAVAARLESDARVYTQGIRNLNDGISLINVADGALGELSSITIRLKELANQAANGTTSLVQRRALDTEAQALKSEYFRIAQSTEFNGRRIFKSDFGSLSIQAGYGANGAIQSNLGGAVGTGVASSGNAYSAVAGANKIELGDLNNDGFLDMVIVGNGIFVRNGTGDGSFGEAVTYWIGSPYNDVSLKDLNGDGYLDIGTTLTGNFAAILLNSGVGTFSSRTTYTQTYTSATGIAFGDMNGDGIQDLVTSGYSSGGYITIRLGVGDGTFGTATSFFSGAGSVAYNDISLSDFNGDGKLDVAVAGTGFGFNIYGYRLGNGAGGLGAATHDQVTGGTGLSIATGDVNGDGRTDIITTGTDYDGSGVVAVHFGNGNGTFANEVTYDTGVSAGALDVTVGDLNGDDLLDLVVVGSTGVTGAIRYGFNTGGNTFDVTQTATMSGTGAGVALGDTNNDGVPDVVALTSVPTVQTRVSNTTAGISPLLPFSLTSRADALQAIALFDGALNRITTQQGVVGAFQSRLSTASSHQQGLIGNYQEALSRIRDVDVAEETAKMVRLQILQQAGSAVLAQANQNAQLVLKLLG